MKAVRRGIALPAMVVAIVGPAWAGATQRLACAATGTPPPPRASAQTWTILSAGTHHGAVVRWSEAGGTRWSHESLNLRGQLTDVYQAVCLDTHGAVAHVAITGTTPRGAVKQSFDVEGRRYRYSSRVGHGEGAAATDLTYYAFAETLENRIELAEQLLRTPGHTLHLVPTSQASLHPLTQVVVRQGTQEKSLTAYAVEGIDFAPLVLWFDGTEFFGSIAEWSYVPQGWEGSADTLATAQGQALAQSQPALLARVAPKEPGPIAFSDVRLFDAEAVTFRDHMNVVVENGRITAVGPAATTAIPAQARLLRGMKLTVLPGLWDSHQHYSGDESGPLLLSQGITSIRDPGNVNTQTVDRLHRIAAEQLLAPTVYASALIDGRSPYSAQYGTIVESLPAALQAVRTAREQGFVGIKIYGSFNPQWVSATAAMAHELGLHVHGHLPAGMRPREAVRNGYDEITHVNMLLMQFLPQAVVDRSNTSERICGTARYAPDIDLTSPAARSFFDELAQRHVVVDPTLVIFESVLTAQAGVLTPAAQPYANTLPLTVDFYYRAGGFAPEGDVTPERMRATFEAFKRVIPELQRRGIAIVAGTDDYGLDLSRELELYVAAGLTPAQGLLAATLAPARHLHADAYTGSIAVGKQADLVMVSGDPGQSIGAIRNVEWVLHDGRLMQGDALRAAAMLSGRPH